MNMKYLCSFVAALVVPAACDGKPRGDEKPIKKFTISIVQGAEGRLDILYVMDTSERMIKPLEWEWDWRLSYPKFFNFPRMPSIHIGRINADLGIGPTGEGNCRAGGGDRGILGEIGDINLGYYCIGEGQRYIVDTEPRSCLIEKDEDYGICTSHSCTQADCDSLARGDESLMLFVDKHGCPRCRNYSDALENAYGCYVLGLPPDGCRFQQPLEAMYQALNNHPENEGFLREDAYLLVVFFTSGQDCSAADPALFDPGQDSMESNLGFWTAYRCFEFGVSCDINDREHVGVRRSCEPRDDAVALLHPVSRYVDFLKQLKDPQLVHVVTCAGPASAGEATISRDEEDRPFVENSCAFREMQGAQPSFRLQSLAEVFTPRDFYDTDEGYSYSICKGCSAVGMRAYRILEESTNTCLPGVPKGCSNVGIEWGESGLPACEANEKCVPSCWVVDVFHRSTPEESRRPVPPCVEIMPDGTRQVGNTDRTVAYAEGHPELRDENLPVEACWYLRLNERCSKSNRAAITIARREDPPTVTFSEVECIEAEEDELECN